MSDVVSLSAFRRKKYTESQNKKPDEVLSLKDIEEKNRQNAERVKRDRYHSNNGVKKDLNLLKKEPI